MTIGIDLSSLQGAHRMRGIGYTLLNLINSMSAADRNNHSFVFYLYPEDNYYPDPLKLLGLDGINYEVRHLVPKKRVRRRLRGKLGIFTGLANQFLELRDLYGGDSRIKDLSGIDYFLQTDQSQCLPKSHRGTKFGLILYDLIPYVLEWDYLWSYKVARTKGDSRKAALRKKAHRWLYAHKIKINTRRAHQLLAISQHTKKDFVRYLGVRESKIIVTPLGVTPPKEKHQTAGLYQYVETSWGYLPEPLNLDKTAYLFYVGGADSRRKLDDLVSAFNMLKAQGSNLKLVLAGDSMQGPKNIATASIRTALVDSSYLKDIIFVGFTDDATRDWLYANALCFVFPSKYEGFGLPVLEAMIHSCPVICYANDATREVAQDLPIYASNYQDIADQVSRLTALSQDKIEKIRADNYKHALQYDWQKTSKNILNIIAD